MSPNSQASSPPAAPLLEYYQNGTTELYRVTLEHSPFKIGRCESSDLRIDSAQVSRVHAEIYQRGNFWGIRDLGSTNGTQLNGRLIREAVLSDGDILMIAETEMTFVASAITPFQRMVTQPIKHRESTKQPARVPLVISQMRALTEATLAEVIPTQIATVVSLQSGACDACFAQGAEPTSLFDPKFQRCTAPAVITRYRELARLQALQWAQAHALSNRILVSVDLTEFEAPDQLLAGLIQLRDGLTVDSELGISIALPELLDPTELYDLSQEVREANLLLGICNFQGSIAQIVDLALFAPDYLVLSDTMLPALMASGQPLHRLELVLTTCQEFDIKPVLPHCRCQKTIAHCRELGYQFALQSMPADKRPDHGDAVPFAPALGDPTNQIGIAVS